MKELTLGLLETEDKELLIDEIMNRYGQEVLQLVFSYVNNLTRITKELKKGIEIKMNTGPGSRVHFHIKV